MVRLDGAQVFSSGGDDIETLLLTIDEPGSVVDRTDTDESTRTVPARDFSEVVRGGELNDGAATQLAAQLRESHFAALEICRNDRHGNQSRLDSSNWKPNFFMIM